MWRTSVHNIQYGINCFHVERESELNGLFVFVITIMYRRQNVRYLQVSSLKTLQDILSVRLRVNYYHNDIRTDRNILYYYNVRTYVRRYPLTFILH